MGCGVQLVRMMIRTLIRLLFFLIPHILHLVGMAFSIMAFSIASLVVGVPRAVDRTAGVWSVRGINDGFPEQWGTLLFRSSRIFAVVAMVAGWLLTLLLLVWLVSVLL